MGVMGTFEWMNTSSKKQCRSLFWRMKAAMKKAVKNKHTFLVALYGGTKKQFNFQYDPSSYALNFDDGTHDDDDHHHDHFLHVVEPHEITKLPLKKQQQESHSSSTTTTTTTTTTWVYVIWVGSF